MTNENKTEWKHLFVFLPAIIGIIGGARLTFSDNQHRYDNQMTGGFKPAREFNIKTEDLDGNGRMETTLRTPDNRNYLLKQVRGEYKLIPYTIECRTKTNHYVRITPRNFISEHNGGEQ